MRPCRGRSAMQCCIRIREAERGEAVRLRNLVHDPKRRPSDDARKINSSRKRQTDAVLQRVYGSDQLLPACTAHL